MPSEPSKPAQNYTVLVTQVGPYVEGQTFSREDFALRNPLPDNEQTRLAGLVDAGVDAYHDALLKRLLDAKAIRAADVFAEPTPPEPGPESRAPVSKKVEAVKAIAADEGTQKKAEAAAKGQRAADGEDRKTPEKK